MDIFLVSSLLTYYIFKGELFELKAELNGERRDVKKDAIKKVIANMTVGKDVR